VHIESNEACAWKNLSISTSKHFSERELKKALRDTDTSSVVWTPKDNCKLANQIAKSAAIVVK